MTPKALSRVLLSGSSLLAGWHGLSVLTHVSFLSLPYSQRDFPIWKVFARLLSILETNVGIQKS